MKNPGMADNGRPEDDAVLQSRRARAASEDFIRTAKARIERTRNLLQAMWLRRELRRRRPPILVTRELAFSMVTRSS